MKRFDRFGQARFTTHNFKSFPYFGGKHCSRRAFRVRRPISTKEPMHFVLRSALAKGTQSFLAKGNRKPVASLVLSLGRKWGVQVVQFANVGNHLHLLVKIRHRRGYKPFICGLTGGIATLVTGGRELAKRFWDYRPYSRVIYGWKAYLDARDYIEINQYEGGRVGRKLAELLVKGGRVVDSG